MRSPITGKEMIIIKEMRNIEFRGEEFSILCNFYLCEETGEKFEDEHFAQLNYIELINQYDKKYGNTN